MGLDRPLAQPQRLRKLGVGQLRELTIADVRRGLSGAADERLQQRGVSGEVAPFRRRPGAGPDKPALVGYRADRTEPVRISYAEFGDRKFTRLAEILVAHL